MAIILKRKTNCPVCNAKTQPVKITPFLKVCPKCNVRVN